MHLDECDWCRRRYRFEESLRIYVRQAVSEPMSASLKQKLAALRDPAELDEGHGAGTAFGPTITTSRRGSRPPGSGCAGTPSCFASRRPIASPPGG